MPYLPISDYGIIGNMRTAALVGMNGSIDWYCSPNFDSPSIFGAILDDAKGGCFRIQPIAEGIRHKQFYWPSTNILVTRFSLEDGIAEIQDFMPVARASDSPVFHQLHRRVLCVRGPIRLAAICRPAFDYGRQTHQLRITKGVATFSGNGSRFVLTTDAPLHADDQGGVTSEFTLKDGESLSFIFSNEGKTEAASQESAPQPSNSSETHEAFQETVKFWQGWLSSCTYRGRWRDRVERSALALKLLTYEPTGAIVAAATTSLPEAIGGPRNWDYRFAWLRDAAFTIYALVRIGFTSEAAGFVIGFSSMSPSMRIAANACLRPSPFLVNRFRPNRPSIIGKAIENLARCASATPHPVNTRPTSTANCLTLFICTTNMSSPVFLRFLGAHPRAPGLALR